MALGRGLDALLGSYSETVENTVQNISLNLIDNNSNQPRVQFDEDKLAELAESIKAHGIVQPILLKKIGERYRIIAGERRFRAARLAGLSEIPAIIKNMSEREMQEVALIENLQRVDLNPIEEASAIKELLTGYGLTQEELASRLGKSRPAIANALRLLSLPQEVQEMLRAGKLSAGHARTLAALDDPEDIIEIANCVVDNKLSVRETEALVKKLQSKIAAEDNADERNPQTQRNGLTGELKNAQQRLTEYFGTKVRFKGNEDKGRIVIEYYSKDDLMNIFDMLIAEK